MNLGRITKKNLDRRQQFRRVPDRFAFLQLEGDDGGAVLNVSEGGLGFSAFAPVEQEGPIHFWFSLNLNERISAWGQVAWTNDTKKQGGLRFTRLSERASRQIREWISRPLAHEVPDKRLAPEAVAGLPSRVTANEPDAVARFVSKVRSGRVPSLFSGENAVDSGAPLPALGATEGMGQLVPMQRYLSAKRRQFRLGFLLGLGISAALVVAAVTYSNYRHESKRITSNDSTVVRSDAQVSTSVTASKPSTRDNPAVDVFAGAKANQGTPSNITPRNPMATAAKQPQPRASEITAGNRPAQTIEGQRSGGAANQRKTPMTPRQLWAATQSGSSNAAVALAELYIKGEGVPQSCDQARVLLLVASEKRNVEAIKRLHELDKTGCP
jgi:PilZ domain